MLEIQHALAVETGDLTLDEENIPEEGLLLSVCSGLVTYEKEGGFLALVHYTFQEYLEQRAKSLFPEAQVEIVRTCLTYLSFDDFEQGPCRKYRGFKVRLEQWPLLRYAVPAWGQHARQGAEEVCKDLILSFLSQSAKVSTSVQILRVRGTMGVTYTRRFPSGASPLWIASIYGLEYIVSHLVASQRQSVGCKTSWGETALHRAAACGNVKILELLLSNGADVTAKDRTGNTSLHHASFFWSGIGAPFILPSMQSEVWEQKARTCSVSLKVTDLLLDYGADVNAVNSNRRTALHLAIMNGQRSLAQLLLARGADVVLKDGFGSAPLTLASKSGYEENIANLVKVRLTKTDPI